MSMSEVKQDSPQPIETSLEGGELYDEPPFPAIAVTTFGAPINRCADFSYMDDIRKLLFDYMKEYPLKSARGNEAELGGAITISGGHGSGKTFLLNWLHETGEGVTSLSCRFLYAKADGEAVSELYRQFMRNLTQQDLAEVIQKALSRIGADMVSSARATENVAPLIQAGGEALDRVYKEKIVDRDEQYLRLKKQLSSVGEAPAVAAKIAVAVGLIEEPVLGRAAFDFLCGGEPEINRPPLPAPLWDRALPPSRASSDPEVEEPLSPAPSGNRGSADIDVAINALECIAALFRTARVPLVFMLDQMETFVPAEPNRAGTAASLIKKLVEQVARQHALLFLAGTGAAFERFPRDVGPRFIRREPTVIGRLDTQETEKLLSAYLMGQERFAPDAVQLIRNLSGGNAREILRIAHHTWRASKGALASVSEDIVIDAAGKSGSLSDRSELARQMIDAAARRAGLPSRPNIGLPSGGRIDRLIAAGNDDAGHEASLAILLAVATDAREEASTARRLAAARRDLEGLSMRPEMLIVAVGYASDRVQAVLKDFSRIITFEEDTFPQQLEREFGRLVLERRPAPVSDEIARGTAAEQAAMLKRLDERLARIETEREVRQQSVEEQLTRETTELSRGRRLETARATRWELIDHVEELRRAMQNLAPDRERDICRSILVSNEVEYGSPAIQYLGAAYIDALDQEEIISDKSLHRQFYRLRSDIVGSMRRELMGLSRKHDVFHRLLPVLSAGFGIAVLLFMYWFSLFNEQLLAIPMQVWLLASSAAGVISALLCFALLWVCTAPSMRYRRLGARLRRMREEEATVAVMRNP